jgi:hypothetical protein
MLLGNGLFDLLSGSAFQIEGEKLFENLLVGKVNGKSICGGDGGIQFLVGQIKPCRSSY